MSTHTITVNLDKRCRECRKKGATQNGLCLRCITRHIRNGDYDERFKEIREQRQKEKPNE